MRYPKSIENFLPRDDEPVISKARKIKELDNLCEQFLPPSIGRHAHAANLKEGTLVMFADNPAIAAKLKLYSEGLCEFLAKRRPEVSSVSVRVQPAAQGEKTIRVGKASALSEGALRGLAQLRERLPESPARRALSSLLERHGQGTAGNGATVTPKAKAPPDRAR